MNLREYIAGIIIFSLHYVWSLEGPTVEALFNVNSAQAATNASSAQLVSCS